MAEVSGKESCRVVYFEHPPGIMSGCAKCRTILRQGTWAVGVIVSETRKYLVGVNPPIECCGEEKKVVDVRNNEDEAKALAAVISAQLNRDGTTANLRLYEAYQTLSDAMH